MLHPAQHFWCLACKSQCLKIQKESPVQFLMSVIKNSLKAFLANPSYPSAPHPTRRRMGKYMGKPPGLEMCCPVIQPQQNASQNTPFPDATRGAPSTCSLALHPEPWQHLSPREAAGDAAGCWKSHSFTCGSCSSITAKATTSPGNELGQLSTTLLLRLC